jgi:hypothetical protein
MKGNWIILCYGKRNVTKVLGKEYPYIEGLGKGATFLENNLTMSRF